MENFPESVKQDIIKEIKELMTEDPYFRDVYQVILELFEKGRDENYYVRNFSEIAYLFMKALISLTLFMKYVLFINEISERASHRKKP